MDFRACSFSERFGMTGEGYTELATLYLMIKSTDFTCALYNPLLVRSVPHSTWWEYSTPSEVCFFTIPVSPSWWSNSLDFRIGIFSKQVSNEKDRVKPLLKN